MLHATYNLVRQIKNFGQVNRFAGTSWTFFEDIYIFVRTISHLRHTVAVKYVTTIHSDQTTIIFTVFQNGSAACTGQSRIVFPIENNLMFRDRSTCGA